METNRQGESRLDRIERLLDRHIIETHDAHAEFRSEHRVLLVAQIGLTAKRSKLAESHAKLDLAMLETTEKLNALIRTVDGIIGTACALSDGRV